MHDNRFTTARPREQSPSTGWKETAEILEAPLAHDVDLEVSEWN